MLKKKILILGSGPGGYAAAIHASQLGCSVTVVEKKGLGGVCLRHGCIPLKSLLHSARILETARNALTFGVICKEVDFDFNSMMKRKDNIVAVNERGIDTLFRKHGIKLIRGSGKLISPSRVEVTDNHGKVMSYDTDCIIIASGSSSAVPPFITPGCENIFDCESALKLESLPDSIAILGGGVQGCEFASLYSSLGVNVTIIEKLETLLPFWDSDLSRRLAMSFKKRSIDVRTGTAVDDVQPEGNQRSVRISLSTGEEITSDCCLLALGRTPNIEDIGLEKAGIMLWEDHFCGIQVNEFLRTTIPNVYAVGDVTGIRHLAHAASAQGITAVEHFCGAGTRIQYDAVPHCCQTIPELASVGVTETEALSRGLDVDISRFSYRSSGIGYITGETDGFVKVIANKSTGTAAGVHICGYGAAEMIAVASVIISNGLTVEDVRHTIFAHPTMAEIIKESILSALTYWHAL